MKKISVVMLLMLALMVGTVSAVVFHHSSIRATGGGASINGLEITGTRIGDSSVNNFAGWYTVRSSGSVIEETGTGYVTIQGKNSEGKRVRLSLSTELTDTEMQPIIGRVYHSDAHGWYSVQGQPSQVVKMIVWYFVYDSNVYVSGWLINEDGTPDNSLWFDIQYMTQRPLTNEGGLL